MVADKQKFDALKQYLIASEKFTSTSNEYTLRDPQGFEVDLFPFGELNIESRKITDKEGRVHTDISGLREVYEEATEEVSFENKYNFRVASLAGIAILKFIAWDDRPEMRSDDLTDVAVIIQHYFELEEKLIYDTHADLFAVEFYDLTLLAARVLGREMGTILQKNNLLCERIIHLLRDKSQGIVRKFSRVLIDDESPGLPDYHDQVVKEIITGIDEYGK